MSVSSSAGFSSITSNNSIVLSEPGVNFQESTQGYQYWGQLSAGGSTTITGIAPGTYHLSIYQLGQWGESRFDGVQVVGNKITIPTNATFTPENFGTAPPIWTIGTPNRSANEFLNGHNASGADQRQYQGSYDYWAEEATLGNQGKVVYYATSVGTTAATNNPAAWIANQWGTFDPGEYDSSNGSTENYANVCPAYVTAGGGPATYFGSPWEVHFATTAAQRRAGAIRRALGGAGRHRSKPGGLSQRPRGGLARRHGDLLRSHDPQRSSRILSVGRLPVSDIRLAHVRQR